MNSTRNLNLPLISAGQAQKHVTHNEALRKLDAAVQLSVLQRNLETVPTIVEDGDRYILSENAIGAFEGHPNEIAVMEDGDWTFLLPQTGWLVWVVAEEAYYVFEGSGVWNAVRDNILGDDLQHLGINAEADDINRLSIRADASLFSHDGADHRLIINKAIETDTASVMLQRGYDGCAELGLLGEDSLSIRTSTDGMNWISRLLFPQNELGVSAPALRSGKVTLGLGEVANIPTPSISGFFLFCHFDQQYPQISHSGVFVFDAGNSTALSQVYAGDGVSNQNKTLLLGETGEDQMTNISIQIGHLQIENRRYSGQNQYCYTFLG